MTRIAVFASGRGSNFQTIFRKIRDGDISAEIHTLITDNEKAGVIAFANEHHIPVHIILPKDFPTPEAFGKAILNTLNRHFVEFIVLAGYLKKIPENVVKAYNNRIVNIHPALLPAFGGKGMYGMRVHEAVFHSGVKISGVTVHLVNCEYDDGPIVMQKAVEIGDCNSPEEIAARVLALEHIVFPQAIKLLLEHKTEVNGKRVAIRN